MLSNRKSGEIREKGNKEEEWWFLFRSIGSLPFTKSASRIDGRRTESQKSGFKQLEWLTTSKTVPLAEQKMLGPVKEIAFFDVTRRIEHISKIVKNCNSQE